MVPSKRHPFAYPSGPHKRRHRPPQYNKYARYKPWLRDEFLFTCVYCLSRETWSRNPNFFGVEHFRAKSTHRAGVVDYLNLLYACNECNRIKGARLLPAQFHPEHSGWGIDLKVSTDGSIAALTRRGKSIVRFFQLDTAELTAWRRKHFEIYIEAIRRAGHPVAQRRLKEFFGFPMELPSLPLNKGAVRPYAQRTGLPEWF